MRLIALGVLLGILLMLLWPGNPAARATVSVTDGLRSNLRSTGPIGPIGG